MSNFYFCFLSFTEWNPDRIPKFAMVDFDNAGESVFNDQDISL